MSAVQPNTSMQSALKPRDLNLIMAIAEALAGPVSETILRRGVERLSRYCQFTHLIMGYIDSHDGTLIEFLVKNDSEFTLPCPVTTTPLLAKELSQLKKTSDWIRPRHHKHLYSKLNGSLKNRKSLLYASSPLANGEDYALRGYLVAVQADKRQPYNTPLLLECLELFYWATRAFQNDSKLQQENKRLNSVLNFSNSLYTTWNEKTGWLYHNLKTPKELGYKHERFDISSLQKRNPVHPDDWQLLFPMFVNLIKNGVNYQHEYRAIGANGDIHWYFAKAIMAESNNRGGAKQIASISINIDNLKSAEGAALAAVRREKWLIQQTHSIFNCASFQDLSTVLKPIGEYLKASRCVIRIIDPETQLCNLVSEWHQDGQNSLAKLFPEMTSQTGIGWIERLIKLGDAYIVNNIDKEVPNKKFIAYNHAIDTLSGVTQPMIVNNKLVGYLAVLDRKPRYWTEIDLRITKVIADTIHMAITRNRLLNELRESETRIQLAMQNSTHSLWDFDLINNALFISPHLFTSLGYREDEIRCCPRTILKLAHRQDRHRLLRLATAQHLNKTGGISFELRLRRKDGSYNWLLIRGKIVKRNKQGKPTQMMGINMEINQLKETLSELRIAREKAEEANHSKSEFLERMSHEIRTPMNAIIGMSYLTLDTDLGKEQRGNLEDIESAAKSLLHVIDDILDFTKIESGELSIVKEYFDLKQMVLRLIKLFSVRANQSNNEFQVNIAEDVPKIVVGDPHRIGQVITNLVSNALKFTKDGTISISVQLADQDIKYKSISLLFSISDSGIGLSEQQLKNLFEPFAQAEDSTTRKYGGTGLGLSICKHLVEMMGGSIQAISLPKVGTTFHFTVVFDQLSDNQINENIVSSTLDITNDLIAPDYVSGKKVLLTEDNIVNQKVAIGLLKKLQIEVVTAINGQEALNILYASPPDEFAAVLMDIEMPILDGLETTKMLRKKPGFSSIPIIAMTAHAMIGDKERCLEAGMNDHIPKPINPAKLLNVLAQTWATSKPGTYLHMKN